MGDGASSATLLGAAKVERTEDFDATNDRVYEDAAAAVNGLIGPAESSRLRQSGALMRNEEASRLARDTLRRLLETAVGG
jgi:hypothetical protein